MTNSVCGGGGVSHDKLCMWGGGCLMTNSVCGGGVSHDKLCMWGGGVT